MKNKLKSLSKILLLSTILLAIPTTLFAHSGRTDSPVVIKIKTT